MFEYNFTTQIEFHQLREDNQKLKNENQMLRAEVDELNTNIQTLLQYNNKLLGIIEEINQSASNKIQKNNQNSQYENYINEIENLRQRIEEYEHNEMQLKDELKRLRNEGNRKNDKDYNTNTANNQQIVRLVMEYNKNSQNVTRKLEEKIDQIFRDVQIAKNTTKQISDQFQLSFEERRSKIQELFDQFEKKDQIVELMGQKVKILQQYYVSKKEQTAERFIQTQNLSITQDSRQTKKNAQSNRQDQEEFNRRIEQKNRIILVYEDLINKLRKKVTEKYF